MPPIALVVDTNFVMSNKELLQAIQSKGQEHEIITVLPFALIQELDAMKRPFSEQIDSRQKQVRAAISWVYDQLANLSSLVRAQKLTEVCEKGLRGDDAILDCCIYFKERKSAFTVLLSNDKNLCNKALVHGIPTVSATKSSTAQTVVDMIVKHAHGQIDGNAQDDIPMEFADDITMNMMTDSDISTEMKNVSSTSHEMDMDMDMDDLHQLHRPVDRLQHMDHSQTQENSNSLASKHTSSSVSYYQQTTNNDNGKSAYLHHEPSQPKKENSMEINSLSTSKYADKARKPRKSNNISPKTEPYGDSTILLNDLCDAIETKLKKAFSSDELHLLYQRPRNFRQVYRILVNFKLPIFGSFLSNQLYNDMKQYEKYTENDSQMFFHIWHSVLRAIV